MAVFTVLLRLSFNSALAMELFLRFSGVRSQSAATNWAGVRFAQKTVQPLRRGLPRTCQHNVNTPSPAEYRSLPLVTAHYHALSCVHPSAYDVNNDPAATYENRPKTSVSGLIIRVS